MCRRLASSALAVLFAAIFAVTGNVTTANADSSAPPKDRGKYSLNYDVQSGLGWGFPD
ncbi:hypothetical protein GCM10010517_09100 [Streptosporangium fragile]|uniref:Uncharacterized protein n=1 Tax=Streptosporangium fragile TaxID=46186 RepID=A0ABP6I9S6_9ACTN